MRKSIDFSILAPIYDFLGTIVFWGALHKSQIHFLDRLPKSPKVLIVGGGTGRFLIDLLKSGKVEEVDYIDISPGMIAKARKKVGVLGKLEQVQFLCGGMESIPSEKYDLICTHYILDCFNEEELLELVPKFKEVLRESGMLHFSDFYLDSSSSILRRSFVGFLYFFFRILCGLKTKNLPGFKKLFEKFGFKEEAEEYLFCRLLRTALYRT